MSYCRWSSHDFKCDLYCYESSEGYVTNVAGNRIVGIVPHMDLDNLSEETYEAQRAFMATCEREPIGGPHDGAHFVDKTLRDFRDRLWRLREAGYRFPQSVLDEVNKELDELEAHRGE